MVEPWGKGKLLLEQVSMLNYSVLLFFVHSPYYNVTLSSEINQSAMLLSLTQAELDS